MNTEVRSSLLAINDWGHPYRIDGKEVPLERPWFSQWHPWRWSVDRPTIEQAVGALADKSVLDVGCQDGWYSFEAAKAGARAVGIDFREEAIQRANMLRSYFGINNASFMVGNVEDAQTLHGSFDVVLNYGLLYHLADPITVMRRLGAVTKRIMAVQTFIHALDRAPVLHLLRESVGLSGKGATELIATPSGRAVVLMFKEAGFDHVYRAMPTDYRANAKPTGSDGYWQWSFWYGVKGEPLAETSTLRRVNETDVPLNHYGVLSKARGLARATARRIRGRDTIGGF